MRPSEAILAMVHAFDDAGRKNAVRDLARRVAIAEEALDVIATCPSEAVHLMPLAAQAALADSGGES